MSRRRGMKPRALRRHTNEPPKGVRWVWTTADMLVSPAWRALSSRAKAVIERVQLEFMRNNLAGNGELVVTYANFRDHGVPDGKQAEAIREAVALGWLAVTEVGRAAHIAEIRRASRYRLTSLPTHDDKPATDDWKAITTDADARELRRLAVTPKSSAKGTPVPYRVTTESPQQVSAECPLHA